MQDKLVLGAVFAVLFLGVVRSTCSSAEQQERQVARLPGSSVALDQAVSCPLVFLGQIVDLSTPEPSAPGQATYVATVRVVQMLKGALEGDVKVSITVRTFPKENAETLPERDHRYLLFAQNKIDATFPVQRILHESSEVVECVKALIKMHEQVQVK